MRTVNALFEWLERAFERPLVGIPLRMIFTCSWHRIHGALVAMAGSERLNVIMSQVLAEMRLFFHKASIDGGFYQDYLADNDQICSALEAGDNDLAAERLLAYLVRSEEHQTAVHAS